MSEMSEKRGRLPPKGGGLTGMGQLNNFLIFVHHETEVKFSEPEIRRSPDKNFPKSEDFDYLNKIGSESDFFWIFTASMSESDFLIYRFRSEF